MHTISAQKASQKWLPAISGDVGPLYLAISAALARDIETGRLAPGDRLPPQRELADALNVDLGTITRAYSEARRQGFIAAEGRRGSFVLARQAGSGSAPQARDEAFDTGMNLPPIPANSTFADRYTVAIEEVLRGPSAANRMQYQPAGGAPPDRQAGAAWLAQRAIPATEDNVLVTSGAQSALHAIANSLFSPGDAVCTASYVYPGWLSVCMRRDIRIVPLIADADGIDPDSFARACAEDTIRAIYLVPTNENPTTATLPLERRKAIAAIAQRHGVAIIEDDPYSCLAAAEISPVASLAPERTWHVASLSKMISPALRIAYLRAPHVRDVLRLSTDLHETTIMAPPLNLAVSTRWLLDGTWAELVGEVRSECAARQKLVAGILGAGSYRAAPEGYHLWVPLASDANAFDLVAAMQPLGVSVVSSRSFCAGSEGRNRSIRLSIGGSLDRERLQRALELLDAMLNHRDGWVMPMV